MNRRNFSTAAIGSLSCLVGNSAFSQDSPKQSTPKDQANPLRKVSAPEDARRVLFFYDFACPYCAQYFGPLLKWSATVPSTVQTLFVPIVNMSDLARRKEQVIAAKCYYAAFALASKKQMGVFAASVYESYPQYRSLESKPMWARALKDAAIDVKKFTAELSSERNNQQTQFAARKVLQYALVSTPSVGVGGKYVLTPDDVAGDDAMFFNILNGLTSEIL
jgi:thiol:disulfide interchange protein DsbA